MYTFPYLILHLSAFAHSCYIRIQQPVMLDRLKRQMFQKDKKAFITAVPFHLTV